MPKSPTDQSHIRSERIREKRKADARAAVQMAVKSGKLLNPHECERCGSGRNVEAHHDDYSKPLDVRWLCKSCHGQWHSKNLAPVGPQERAQFRCEHCGGSFTPNRSDARYCNQSCRRDAHRSRAHEGRLVAKRQLKSGEWSLIVRLPGGRRTGDRAEGPDRGGGMIEPVTSRTHPYPKVWVKLAAYCKLAGEEKDAVISRRRRGRWLDGRHTKVVDGHLYVNVPEADRWVEENGR